MAKKEQMNSQWLLKLISIFGLLSAIMAMVIFFLWIYVFNKESNHADRLTAFKTFFPHFLQGRWDTTYLGLFCCFLGIALSGYGKDRLQKPWQIVNLSVIIICSLLFVVLAIGLL